MLQSATRTSINDLLGDSAVPAGTQSELEDDFASQAVERVFSALSKMESMVDAYEPAQRERESRLQAELSQLQQENASLKAGRQELVQAVRALKSHNDTLALQIDEISNRLETALGKVTSLLQAESA